MMVASRTVQIGALLVLGVLSIGALFFVFEYQYMWHVQHTQYLTLRVGFVLGALILIALWVFGPVYWAVVTVGVLIFLFPAFVPNVPAMSLSLGFLVAMAI